MIKDRIMLAVPLYYQYSSAYNAIIDTKAQELELVGTNNADLFLQLFIPTATWGLKYYEYDLGIPIVETDSYEIRRSRVLSKSRSQGQFSADQIKSVSESFARGEVDVTVDTGAQSLTVKFIDTRGVPENLDDLKAQIGDIVHAHMEVVYAFTYLTWDELDAANLTWDQRDALNLTWDEFEIWEP